MKVFGTLIGVTISSRSGKPREVRSYWSISQKCIWHGASGGITSVPVEHRWKWVLFLVGYLTAFQNVFLIVGRI